MKKMNDQDYIKTGAELADGWTWTHTGDGKTLSTIKAPHGFRFYRVNDGFSQVGLDALAAQLVRQVDEHHEVFAKRTKTHVCSALVDGGNSLAMQRGPDRTMNTIKAVVDSGVLEAIDND